MDRLPESGCGEMSGWTTSATCADTKSTLSTSRGLSRSSASRSRGGARQGVAALDGALAVQEVGAVRQRRHVPVHVEAMPTLIPCSGSLLKTATRGSFSPWKGMRFTCLDSSYTSPKSEAKSRWRASQSLGRGRAGNGGRRAPRRCRPRCCAVRGVGHVDSLPDPDHQTAKRAWPARHRANLYGFVAGIAGERPPARGRGERRARRARAANMAGWAGIRAGKRSGWCWWPGTQPLGLGAWPKKTKSAVFGRIRRVLQTKISYKSTLLYQPRRT